MQTIALFFLASVAVGGVAWVFVYPILSGERKAEQRMASVAKAEPAARATRGSQKSRRDVIENTLKEFDERHKKVEKHPALGPHRAGRPVLVEAAILHDFGRHRRGDVLARAVHRRRPRGGRCARLCRRASVCRAGCCPF